MSRVVSKDVAIEAGVSKTTVSNYFNSPEKLSPDVAERVRGAIEKLGYIRNDVARQLRAGRSNVIAYVVFEVSNTYFSDVADAIERRAAEAGLFVIVGNNNGDRDRESAYLELFEAQGVRGIIIAPTGHVEQTLDAIRKRGTPSVMTGVLAEMPDQPSVSVENARGGYLAAQHLLAIGRRHLAFLGGPLDIRQISDRFLGASQAVSETPGATLEVYPVDERSIQSGMRSARRILDTEPARRPDGVFAANDLLGIGLVDGLLQNSDLKIPEDVAIIGFDDLDIGNTGLIPLSTIRTPHEDFGRVAVELLLAELGELPARSERHVVFEPELVVRASTVGPFPHRRS